MLDVKLVRAIQGNTYDAWSEPVYRQPDDKQRFTLRSFADEQQQQRDPDPLRFVKSEKWRRLVAWDLGKLGEPNTIVVLKYRYIETGWGFSTEYQDFPKRFCVTPVYQVMGMRESHDDYSYQVEELQKRIDTGTMGDIVDLVYDASGTGSAVSQQIRHLQGFRYIVPVVFSNGAEIKRQNRFVVEGRSRLLADLEQVVKQRRLRIPDKQSLEKLNRQLAGMRVEETVQGYYRNVDQRTAGHHWDSLITLGMGISYVETIAAKLARCRAC